MYECPASSAAAIRRMRHASSVRTLWVDAICIDQDNLEERAQQVGQMGRVYRSSQKNLIYLGECRNETSTKLALQEIQTVLKDLNEETNDMTAVVRGTTLFDHSDSTAETGMKYDVNFDLLTQDIFSLPWFR
jgi:hypothetical protein